jgi:ribosome-associated protein
MSDRMDDRAEQMRGPTGLVLEAAEAAASKKAERIVILDISKQLVITDHFLICNGNTERQVRTISEEVERRLLQSRTVRPIRREGERDSRWVVLDYGDFIVHVFHREERDYYDLERLWADAEVVPFVDPWEGSDEPAAAEAT